MEKKKIVANYTPLWPTPFGWANLGEDYRELNKRLVDDIETEMKLGDNGKDGTFRNNNLGWQSKNSMEDRYPSFAQLVSTISSVAGALMEKSGVASNEGTNNVRNLWANVIFGQGGYSFPHTHGMGDTLWSGVYYPKGLEDIENLDELDVSENFAHGITLGGGKLIIRDGNISKELVQPLDMAIGGNDRQYSVNPRESLLVLFPAWVEHMVTPTENDIKRYSISFGIYRHSNFKSHGPETRTAEKMGWVTSDSHDDTIKDEVTVEKE